RYLHPPTTTVAGDAPRAYLIEPLLPARALTCPPGTAAPLPITLAFCWSHLRRKFCDLHVKQGSPVAEEALRRIAELYRIESEIRGQAAGERQAIRAERSRPLVEAMRTWID
ncbi:IS66 family transposase, partial [Tritonibacter sp. SIMBA_163]|uniref:IS66 family transposase n=1 Tax=Tritonibacter sp. SIMBA_163 TaxID=3080868 RepID=UPI00397F3D7E